MGVSGKRELIVGEFVKWFRVGGYGDSIVR